MLSLAQCSVCYCVEFSDAEPKRAPPGCADPAHGWCAECVLRALTTGGRRHYFVAKDRRTLPWAAYFCDGCRQSEQREAEKTAIIDELIAACRAFATDPAAPAEKRARAAFATTPSLVHREIERTPDARSAAAALRVAAAARPCPGAREHDDARLFAEWAIAELKAVHAGSRNRHLHEALDAAPRRRT